MRRHNFYINSMNRNKNKVGGFTLVEALVVLTIILALLVIVGIPSCKMMGGVNKEYSEGSRTGVVYKISKKGFIWNTYEGEMSLQLTSKDSEGQLVNEKFLFSVSDESVAKDIEEASKSGNPITLHYQQYWMRGYKYGSTGYDIIGVDFEKEDSSDK